MQEFIVTEAAKLLGVSRQRLLKVAKDGRIGRQVAGHYWVFRLDELINFERLAGPQGGRPKGSRNRGPRKVKAANETPAGPL